MNLEERKVLLNKRHREIQQLIPNLQAEAYAIQGQLNLVEELLQEAAASKKAEEAAGGVEGSE